MDSGQHENKQAQPGLASEREARRELSLAEKRRQKVEESVHVQAIKQVAVQAADTAKLAIQTLREVLAGKIGIQHVHAPATTLLVVYCEVGRELRDDVATQIMTLMKMPLIVLPKDMALDAIPPETMKAAGWVRAIEVVR